MTYKQLKKILATKDKTNRNMAEKRFGIHVYWTTEHLKQADVRYQKKLFDRIEYAAQVLGIHIDDAYYYYGKGEYIIEKIDRKKFHAVNIP